MPLSPIALADKISIAESPREVRAAGRFSSGNSSPGVVI
jgi:hypothetical protein